MMSIPTSLEKQKPSVGWAAAELHLRTSAKSTGDKKPDIGGL